MEVIDSARRSRRKPHGGVQLRDIIADVARHLTDARSRALVVAQDLHNYEHLQYMSQPSSLSYSH